MKEKSLEIIYISRLLKNLDVDQSKIKLFNFLFTYRQSDVDHIGFIFLFSPRFEVINF
jgi:hypothetical protein